MNERLRTPEDGLRLEHPDPRPAPPICTCAQHCSNRCQPGCCGPGSPSCSCWCHGRDARPTPSQDLREDMEQMFGRRNR